jgi:hypothetical protein
MEKYMYVNTMRITEERKLEVEIEVRNGQGENS